MFYTNSVEIAQRLSRELSSASGKSVTVQDMLDWIGEDGPGAAYDEVDAIVAEFLGDEMYNEALENGDVLDVLSDKLAS